MPISSTQISALTGGFNQQVMLGMQHSAMITQQYGGYAPNPSLQPAPTQGQNFANLMTMAGGQRAMGMMESLGNVPVLGGIASSFGQMGIGQMMYGAQQQQMLQTNLQQAFRQPNEFGGRGFTQTQIQGIGSNLRQMALERGPGGEQTSFDELGRLASNMGRMGLAQNVRTVRDFNEKFKEMLETVKTVATEMGTSLEEAQKAIVSMKGAGIFRNQDQVATMMRQGALAGNLGMSELTAAAQMGSHFSRSIGGLGSAGAMGGIRAISNIGAAQQAGVINEEDIYNVTGLTGAEGRQAMVQRQLGGDAAFLRSSMGKRFLASIAGKGGTINASDVTRWQGGGVGTGETMQMAHGNLAKVGRADFIRNLGRLRGKALEEFGGLAEATFYSSLLENKGMDMDSDRTRLFLQRKTRKSRDEVDVLMKQIQGLDATRMQRDISRQEDEFTRDMDIARRRASPAEIIKKFEGARDKVTTKLRQFGADLNSSLTVFFDNMMGKITKNYELRVDRTLGPLAQGLRSGFASESALERELGMAAGGGAIKGSLGAQLSALGGDFAGNKGVGSMQIANLVRGNYDKLRRAGMTAAEIRNITTVEQVNAAQRRLVGSGEGGLTGILRQEGNFATLASRGMAIGNLAAGGVRDVGDFNVLKDPLTQASLLAGGKESKAGRFIQGIEAFTTDKIFDPLKSAQESGLRNARRIAQAPRRAVTSFVKLNEMIARGISDDLTTDIFGKNIAERVGTMLGDVLGDWEEGNTASIEALFGGASKEERRASDEFLERGAGSELLKDLATGDKVARERVRTRTRDQINELRKKKDLTEEEKGQLSGLESVRAAQEMAEWAENNGRKPETEDEIKEIARRAGVDPSVLVKRAEAAGGAYRTARDDSRQQLVEASRRGAEKQLKVVRDALKAGREGLKKLNPETKEYLFDMEESLERQVNVTKGASPEEVKGALGIIRKEGKAQKGIMDKRLDELKGLTVREKREKLAQIREEEAGGEMVADVGEERVALEERFARGARLGGGGLGVTREIGRAIGVGLSRKDLLGLRGKGAKKAVELMLKKSGVTDLEGEGAEGAVDEIRQKLMDISSAKSPEEKAKIMQGLRREHGATFAEARREQQDKKSESEDPSYRKLEEINRTIERGNVAMLGKMQEVVTAVGEKVQEGGGDS